MDKGFIELEKNKVGVICNRFSDLLQNNTDSYFDSFNYTKEIIEKGKIEIQEVKSDYCIYKQFRFGIEEYNYICNLSDCCFKSHFYMIIKSLYYQINNYISEFSCDNFVKKKHKSIKLIMNKSLEINKYDYVRSNEIDNYSKLPFSFECMFDLSELIYKCWIGIEFRLELDEK